MTYEDRLELLISAVVGAVVGLVIGHVFRYGWMNMVVWGLIGAFVVSGMVYVLRASR